jgi:hypothetical protein
MSNQILTRNYLRSLGENNVDRYILKVIPEVIDSAKRGYTLYSFAYPSTMDGEHLMREVERIFMYCRITHMSNVITISWA